MINVTICVDNKKDKKRALAIDAKTNPYLVILNEEIRDEKKESYKVKNTYGARLCPFILIESDGEYLKAIWKEASKDPIEELTNFLNNYGI